MVVTNRLKQDPYEDVLKQLLAEIAKLRQTLKLMPISACKNTMAIIIPALIPKAPVILRTILPCDNLICVIYRIAWLTPVYLRWAELKHRYYQRLIR